jgi:hypothetical protein
VKGGDIVKHKVFKYARFLCLVSAMVGVLMFSGVPVYATAGVFEDIAGTYTIRGSFQAYYLDNTRSERATAGTLTISDNTLTTLGKITNASLTVTGVGTVAMVGFVGAGTSPRDRKSVV